MKFHWQLQHEERPTYYCLTSRIQKLRKQPLLNPLANRLLMLKWDVYSRGAGWFCFQNLPVSRAGQVTHGYYRRSNYRANRRREEGKRPPRIPLMAEAGALDPVDETFREYERVVDPKYLKEIRAEAKQFSTNLLSRQSRVAKCAIRHFKNGKDTIKPRTLRKLTMAIHELQSKNRKN